MAKSQYEVAEGRVLYSETCGRMEGGMKVEMDDVEAAAWGDGYLRRIGPAAPPADTPSGQAQKPGKKE